MTIEEDVQEMGRAVQAEKQQPKADLAAIARTQAISLVGNICGSARQSISERRDELDNLMERMTLSEKALVRYIEQFAQLSAEVMIISDSIKAEIADAASPFRADPPTTITLDKA